MPAPTLLGDGGRNILVGPGLTNTNISLARNISLRRIFDNLKLFDATGKPVAGAGLLDTTATSSRQIQFALKLIW